MKPFLKTVGLYITIVILALFVLEWLFTYGYYNPKNPRSTTSWIMSFDSKDTLDYALFGSSRCIHTVNPTIINKEYKTNGLNLAYAASNPMEIKLSLKTLLKKQYVKRIFVQVDYSYDQHGPHPLAEIAWMPFLKEDYVYNELKQYDTKYWYLKNIPFYRYMKYDAKIGVRDFLFNYTKKSDYMTDFGYVPLFNELISDKVKNTNVKHIENPHLKEVIDICAEEEIEIDFFTAPIYRFEGDYSALSNYLPNYHNFATVITDRGSFQDNTHLNYKGAKVFTNIFMDYYFLNDKN